MKRKRTIITWAAIACLSLLFADDTKETVRVYKPSSYSVPDNFQTRDFPGNISRQSCTNFAGGNSAPYYRCMDAITLRESVEVLSAAESEKELEAAKKELGERIKVLENNVKLLADTNDALTKRLNGFEAELKTIKDR